MSEVARCYMSVENKHEWDVALKGLERFFDEGMTLWTKEKFISLFSSNAIATSEYVVGQLRILEDKGAIVFVGEDEIYIKVVSI